MLDTTVNFYFPKAIANLSPALAVLSDPTRRRIFERVAANPSAVGDLARGLPLSRPAVLQHLRVLKDAGMVSDIAEGTRRIYRLDPRGIGVVRDWLDTFRSDRFADFAQYVETHPEEKP